MDASRYSTCGRGETEPQTQPRASGSAPTFDVYPPIGALTDVELVNTGVLETFARSQSCGSLDSSSSLVAQFLTAATGARTSVAKPNSSCQSTEIEQTFQSSNLDPWFRDPPNSLEPALTAVSHFPPQQLRQPTRPCTTFLGLTYSAASPLLASWSVYCLTMALCWKWFASEDELEAPCEIVVEETEVLRPRLGNSAGSLTTTRYYSST
jgi:hypothetical protein